MSNLLEEVKEHFDFIFNSKRLNFCDINSYEFCDLKLIKDYQDQLTQEGRMVDGIFLSDLVMLYLYLTQSLHLLRLSVVNEDTKRAGVDIIAEQLMPRLRDFREFVLASIKSTSERVNLDSDSLAVFDISEKDNKEYLEREGVKPKATKINPEEERLKINRFLRGENLDLSITSEQYVDHDKKRRSDKL